MGKGTDCINCMLEIVDPDIHTTMYALSLY